MPPSISLVANHLGKYASLKSQLLFGQLIYSSPYLRDGTIKTIHDTATDGVKVGFLNFTMTSVWQGGIPEYNHMGDSHFSVESAIQRQHKFNVSIHPENLHKEWEGSVPVNGTILYDESKKPKKMPYTQFVINRILEQVGRDRDQKVLMKAKYAPPVLGSPSPPEKSLDGINEILRQATVTDIDYGDRIGSKKLVPMTLGAIPDKAEELIEYFREFKYGIPEQYRTYGLIVIASETVRQRYFEALKTVSRFDKQYNKGVFLDASNIEFRSLPGMEDSDLVFAYAPGNLQRIINKNDGASGFITVNDAEIYTIRVVSSWHETYSFSHFDYVFSNDQIPPA